MSEPEELPSWVVEAVPESAVRIFRMAWQLENWLRTMVYVELRADRTDWKEPILKQAGNQSNRYIEADKKLHHMTTPHVLELSYLSFGKTWDIISDSLNWPLFEPYFPPKANATIRIEEAMHIRNRIAHFREPHADDESRFKLFMREMESGIRKFCERYSEEWRPNPANDPIANELQQSWQNVGYGIEFYGPNGWLYAPEPHRQNPKMNATLKLLCHSNHKPGSLQGDIYKLTFSGNRQGKFDTVSFVENTEGLHKDIIHILLVGPHNEPAVTIPAIQGAEATAELIGCFLQAALENQCANSPRNLDREKLKWPEHIIWPGHMLTMFDKDMREPVLSL